MPSGNNRMNSSNDPGRWVGLITPTTPRQLVKATLDSYYSRIEIRNPNIEIRNKLTDLNPNNQIQNELVLDIVIFGHLKLFRISSFEFVFLFLLSENYALKICGNFAFIFAR
jgi:hypothetical protein